MNIGQPKRIIEVEPVSLPLPEPVPPQFEPTPVEEPVPAEPEPRQS